MESVSTNSATSDQDEIQDTTNVEYASFDSQQPPNASLPPPASQLEGFSGLPMGPMKIFVGIAQVIATYVSNYVSGFVMGGVAGSVTAVPSWLFQSSVEASLIRQRAWRWSRSFGAVSGFFSGLDALIYVVRNGQHDRWSVVWSSAGAGMYYARNKGPLPALRAGAMYGGAVLLAQTFVQLLLPQPPKSHMESSTIVEDAETMDALMSN